ncbi:MAG TPA: J domain-containing protein [Acidimicrobiales bacterium]
MTHYEVLGVPPSASAAEVRRAYVALARRHHPDFHGGESPADQERNRRRMQEVNAAWHVLGDPDRRRAYDLSLRRPAPAPTPAWRPVAGDDEDDLEGVPAARLPEDVAAPGEARHRWLAVAPVFLMTVAVLAAVVGMVTNVLPLVALAGGCGVLSFGLFVLAPLVVMSESARRSPP